VVLRCPMLSGLPAAACGVHLTAWESSISSQNHSNPFPYNTFQTAAGHCSRERHLNPFLSIRCALFASRRGLGVQRFARSTLNPFNIPAFNRFSASFVYTGLRTLFSGIAPQVLCNPSSPQSLQNHPEGRGSRALPLFPIPCVLTPFFFLTVRVLSCSHQGGI
jgi:hypothetical protein